MTEKLPEWAEKMSDEEWKKLSREDEGYTNCAICKKRLILTPCRYGEKTYYCEEHCPTHKWQTDYDCPKECAKCGVPYSTYLENVLVKNGIKY